MQIQLKAFRFYSKCELGLLKIPVLTLGIKKTLMLLKLNLYKPFIRKPTERRIIVQC